MPLPTRDQFDAPVTFCERQPDGTYRYGSEPAVYYRLVFQSPGGTFTSYAEALTWCEQNDFDPHLVLQLAVCVETANGHYAIRRMD